MKPILLALACFSMAASAALHAQQPPAPAAAAPAAAAPAQPDFHRAPAQWNVADENHAKLALQGWDPVAYFPEGGGKPAEGSEKISVVQGGITYRFASDEHRKLFVADPWKYEPAYGGWCAYAMAKGEKVEVDPESFRILDGRLFVFYDGIFANTRKSWLEDEAALLAKADAAWAKLSGENNRGDAARADAIKAAKG